MSNVFVVSARCTPFGSFDSDLATIPAPQLTSQVLRLILAENGLQAGAVTGKETKQGTLQGGLFIYRRR